MRACAASGRGLFATKDLAPGTLIEVAPAIVMPAAQYEAHGRHTILSDYAFKGRDGSFLLALGVGSLFNHSRRPNVDYKAR